MNCVCYLRVSGNAQIDGTGIDRQIELCQKFAIHKDLTISNTFEELAVSGTMETDDRPAFQSMLAYILKEEITVILIERMDRLHRAYRLQEDILLYLAAKGITVYIVTTGENITESILGDPMKVALVQMQGVFAQFAKSELVYKLRKGREITRSKTGRCEGQKYYGGHPEKPDEVKSLAMMRSLRVAGLTYDQIADALNSNGVLSRKGKSWMGCTIGKILKRESA